MKRKTLSTLAIFLTSVIWGVAFVAQRAGMEYVGSLTFGGVRFALGALSLIPVALVFERKVEKEKTRRTLFAGLIAGVILFIAVTLQQYGIEITGSASKAGFITGLYTIIVPIIGLFTGKKTTVFTWISAVIACAGLYLLSASNGLGAVGIGDIVLLLGAVFWAFHIIAIDRFVSGISPIRFAMTQFVVCAAISMVCAFIFEDVTLPSILAARVPLLYGGILSAGVAYTLQIIGQRDVEPAKAAIIFSTESLFSALGAAVLLKEMLGGRGYAGCGLIFAGILISQIRFFEKSPRGVNAEKQAKPSGA